MSGWLARRPAGGAHSATSKRNHLRIVEDCRSSPGSGWKTTIAARRTRATIRKPTRESHHFPGWRLRCAQSAPDQSYWSSRCPSISLLEAVANGLEGALVLPQKESPKTGLQKSRLTEPDDRFTVDYRHSGHHVVSHGLASRKSANQAERQIWRHF